MLGSQETLLEGVGNEFDLASLLIALLRASGTPARYVLGTVMLPADHAMNWLGVKNATAAESMFRYGGMLNQTISDVNGSIVAFDIWHVWVEAYIGERWISMDPSFRRYEYHEGLDLTQLMGFNMTTFLLNFLNGSTIDFEKSYVTSVDEWMMEEESNQYLRNLFAYFEANPEITFGDLWGWRRPVDITDYTTYFTDFMPVIRFSAIPNTLRHSIQFRIPSPLDDPVRGHVFNVSVPEVAGKRITLCFPPADAETLDLINSFGGLLNTPPYLVKLVPELMIEGDVVLVGDPVTPGTQLKLYVTFSVTGAKPKEITHEAIAGGYYTLGLCLQRVPRNLAERMKQFNETSNRLLESARAGKGGTVELDSIVGELLHQQLWLYHTRVLAHSFRLARQLNVVYAKGVSEAWFGIDVGAYYSEGKPVRLTRGGLNIDVMHSPDEVFSKTGKKQDEIAWNLSKDIYCSIAEGFLISAFYGTPSITAASVLWIASQRGIPIHAINQDNIDQILPLLAHERVLKVPDHVIRQVEELVSKGFWVVIPQTVVPNIVLTVEVAGKDTDYVPKAYKTWFGVGWLEFNNETGECGTMIEGRLGSSSLPHVISGGSQAVDHGEKEPEYAVTTTKEVSDATLDKNGTTIESKEGTQTYQTLNEANQVVGLVKKVGEVLEKLEVVELVGKAKTVGKVLGKAVNVIGLVFTGVDAYNDGKEISELHPEESKAKRAVKGAGAGALRILEGITFPFRFAGNALGRGCRKAVDQIDSWIGDPEKTKDEYQLILRCARGGAALPALTLYHAITSCGEAWEEANCELEPLRKLIIEGGKPEHPPSQSRTPSLGLGVNTGIALRPSVNLESASLPDLYVTGPHGSPAGLDPFLGNVTYELRDTTYSGPGTTPQAINVWNPVGRGGGPGEYKFSLIARSSADYALHVELSAYGITLYNQSYVQSIHDGETQLLTVVIIPKPETGDMTVECSEPRRAYLATFSVAGLPLSHRTSVYVDGVWCQTLPSGVCRTLAFEFGSSHSISVEGEIPYGLWSDRTYRVSPDTWAFSSGAFTRLNIEHDPPYTHSTARRGTP